MTSDPTVIGNLTRSIVKTGIAAAGAVLVKTDSNLLQSLASDLTKGATTGLAAIPGINVTSNVQELSQIAISSVKEALSQDANLSTILSSFASKVASAVSSGLSDSGNTTIDISSINSSLGSIIANQVAIFVPNVDANKLAQQVIVDGRSGIPIVTETIPNAPMVTVNSGAMSTSQSNVTLKIMATDASDIYVTNIVNCVDGGLWQTPLVS